MSMYLVNNVEALYPRINKTYRFDNVENRSVPCDPLDDGAAYEMSFRMSKDQAKELFTEMAKAYQEKREDKWPAKLDMPFKKDDDGMFTHKAKLKGAYGNEPTRKPVHYDAKGIKLPEDFMLTNGSLVNVAIVFVPYNMRDNGVSLRLRAVQVIDLKPMQDDSPFTAVEGFEATASDNPFEEDAPIQEPKKVVKKVTPEPKKGGDDLASIVDNWDD